MNLEPRVTIKLKDGSEYVAAFWSVDPESLRMDILCNARDAWIPTNQTYTEFCEADGKPFQFTERDE